jgi:hypothetical protein
LARRARRSAEFARVQRNALGAAVGRVLRPENRTNGRTVRLDKASSSPGYSQRGSIVAMLLAIDLVSFVSRCTVDGVDHTDQPLPFGMLGAPPNTPVRTSGNKVFAKRMAFLSALAS